MPAQSYDPKGTGCTTCELDTMSCPSTSDLPAPGNGLNGSQYNGFTQTCGSSNQILQQVNFIGGKYRVGDYLNILGGDGQKILPLFRQMYERIPAITRLLFDWEEYIDPRNGDGKPLTVLSFKSLPNNPTVWNSPDGKTFIYTEFRYKRPKAFVVRDESNSNQVLIGLENGDALDTNSCDPIYQDMFQVDDVILIHANGDDSDNPDCCSRLIQRSIVAMDVESWNGQDYMRLTFEDQPTANADLPADSYKGRNGFGGNTSNTALDPVGGTYPGDAIQRLYKTRNDNDRITGRVNDIPDDVKLTNIQHFFNQIAFEKDELNISFAIEEEAIGVIKRKINNINRNFIDEIANSFYFGRNRGQNSAVTYTHPVTGETRRLGGETMGVLPALYEAHAMNPYMGIIQSAERLRSDDDFVRLFLDQLLAVQESGILNQGEAISVLMDRTAFNAFHKLNAARNRLVGHMVTSTNQVSKEFQIPTITTSMGSIEFLTCTRFSELLGNTGNILFIPTKMVAMVQRENDKYDIATGSVTKQTMGFKTKDITVPAIHGHERQIFDIFGEWAIALGMTDSGAWRMIQGFKR